jgi:wyosine [tRNA(Phe)-imidazoG37] synthetase (radical SAM superfamily)
MLTAPAQEVKSHFGIPRAFLNNRYVYVTVSPRAKGLSVGVNFNPDKQCNYDCVYCEVNRLTPPLIDHLDIDEVLTELADTLQLVQGHGLRDFAQFRALPECLLQLKHVCLSGDGEPTLSPHFLDLVQGVFHLRARGKTSFFKVILATNASNLHRAEVQQGIQCFTKHDELWLKLDAGTPEYLRRVNRTDVPLERVLANSLLTARSRPVVIQSLFASLNGEEPDDVEIEQYAARLRELVEQGAQISLVQIYSATRPISGHTCAHLALRNLSRIAQIVRARSNLKVEIF